MPATPKFAHVVYQTGQPEAMRDWYCRVLDAHVVFANPAITFLTFDDEHHRVALLHAPALVRKTPATAAVHHTAYTFASLDELLARYERLRDDGIRPAVCVAHGVTSSLYYRDPDGNFVELQVDAFGDADAATAYMHGPEFTADPVGPAFDPDEWLRRRRAGAPASDLLTRAWCADANLPPALFVLTGAAP